MHRYQHILVAADLIPSDDDPIADRAIELAGKSGAKISLVHVVEAFGNYISPYVISSALEWEKQTKESARARLCKLGERLGIPPKNQIVTVGDAKTDIISVAQEVQADLIIVGSHGRHGLSLFLFGSTANDVMRNAKCDVLVVNLSQESMLQKHQEKTASTTC